MYFRSPDMAMILYRIYWKPEDRYTGWREHPDTIQIKNRWIFFSDSGKLVPLMSAMSIELKSNHAKTV